jgi:two-component system LytT family response regulator
MKVLIVDDEPVARRRMRRLLRSVPDVEIAGECGDGRSAVGAIAALGPDLVLLDVQMPEMDGFEVVARVGAAAMPPVVFVTAFEQFAIRAFEVSALDYLLKPFSADRLREAIDRARARDAAGSRLAALMAELRQERRSLTRLAVRQSGRILLVDLADVDWIESADNYVTLHAGAREHLVRETMARLERELDPNRFVRIHRRAIVQVDRIAELVPTAHGDFVVRLRDGRTLMLTRAFRERVEKMLGRRL